MDAKRTIVPFLLLLALWLGAGRAWAVCTTVNPAVSLGSVSSFTLNASAQGNLGGAGLTCGSFLALLAANYVQVTLQSAAPVLSDGNGNSIPLKVFVSNGGAEITPGSTVQLSSLAVLALLTNATTGINLYFQAQAANVPAGTYTASVVFTWRYAICESGALNLCSWQRSPGVTQNCPAGLCGTPTNWGTGVTATSTVTLVVTKACALNSYQNVDLGSQALVSQFTSVTRAITLTCTSDEGYLVSFDNGQNYQAPWRRMASGANHLGYNIYFPNTTTVWNTTQNLSQKGTGLQQTVNFQVTVDPTQANVPVGTYIDNVTLIINY